MLYDEYEDEFYIELLPNGGSDWKSIALDVYSQSDEDKGNLKYLCYDLRSKNRAITETKMRGQDMETYLMNYGDAKPKIRPPCESDRTRLNPRL